MNEERFAAAIEAEEAGHLRLARGLYEECLEQAPGSGSIWLRYISLLQDQREYQEAIDAGDKLLACELNDERRALAHNILGQCRVEQGDFATAEAHFRSARQLRPDPGACVFLYMSLLRQQREEEGVVYLREALALDAHYEEAHYNLGCYHKRGQRDEEAERCFRRAIELDPAYGRAFAELGLLLTKKGAAHEEEARQVLARAVELVPEYGWARLYYANLLWRAQELAAAEEQYQSALALWPSESLTHRSYGRFLSDTERDEGKAETLLRRAIELAPTDAVAHKMLGRHLLRYGRADEACDALERSVALGDESARKYLKLAKKHQQVS
jgi:tetratricopeptide (TPR) repeat protein